FETLPPSPTCSTGVYELSTSPVEKFAPRSRRGNRGESRMSSNATDCSSIEQRINEYNLYISTTQDQVNKLDLHDPDIQNKRDALTRKLDNLHEQQGLLQHALEDC